QTEAKEQDAQLAKTNTLPTSPDTDWIASHDGSALLALVADDESARYLRVLYQLVHPLVNGEGAAATPRTRRRSFDWRRVGDRKQRHPHDSPRCFEDAWVPVRRASRRRDPGRLRHRRA